MPLTIEVSDELRGLIAIEKQHGARLRLADFVRKAPTVPAVGGEGPLRLSGKDRRGRPVSAVGDEAFLCMMIRKYLSGDATPAPLARHAESA